MQRRFLCASLMAASVGKRGLEEVADDSALLLFRNALPQTLRRAHSLLGNGACWRPTGNAGAILGVTVHRHLLSDLNLRP